MNGNTRRYLNYAAGEIALVIAGILIALQINAWHEDRQIRDNLKTQLKSVAESISQDLTNIARLKRHRIDSIFGSNKFEEMRGPIQSAELWYSQDFVRYASSLIASSQIPAYFVPGSGAYKVFESSGHANYIDDGGLRRNLHDYYASVERIVFAERQINGFISDLTLKYQTDTTRGVYKPFLEEPLLAWSPQMDKEIARTFQDAYLRILNDSVTQALIRAGRSQPLLKEYEQLLSLGAHLLSQIDTYLLGEQQPDNVLFQTNTAIGPASVFQDGRFEAHSLGLFSAPAEASFSWGIHDLVLGKDYLRINYAGGDDWLLIYPRVGPIDIAVDRHFLDYSRFSRIRLELKRHRGCENLRLILKDAEDADDGSQANVPLDLSDDWKYYDYELSLFRDADLSKLHVVGGFLLGQAPCSFSIRNMTYL